MSQRDDAVAMHHMLDHAREALELIGTRSRADIHSDRLLQLALTRLVEIVGEAASRVPHDTQGRFPDVPWREAVTTRNRMTHGYDVVDHDIVWDTVEADLPISSSRPWRGPFRRWAEAPAQPAHLSARVSSTDSVPWSAAQGLCAQCADPCLAQPGVAG
jgi:uncharacterized protein with HEPN domain